MKAGKINRNFAVAALVACMTTLAATASAIPLFPGGMVSLAGTTAAAQPNLAGLVLVDTLRPFTTTVNGTVYSGTVQDRVVRETSTGKLDFYYRIMLDKQWLQDGQLLVGRANFPAGSPTATAFTGITTDVNYRLDGLGLQGPAEAARTSDGNWVIFSYDGITIGPGSSDSTRFTYISTNAKKFNASGKIVFLFSGGTPVVLPAYAPTN